MSGFYLFVLWLSDEKVSVITISCSLLYEGSERCSLTVCIEKNNVLKKPLKNMGIKMGKKYSCFIGGSINRIERKIYFWHCDTFWICSHCHCDPSILTSIMQILFLFSNVCQDRCRLFVYWHLPLLSQQCGTIYS